MLLDRIHFPSDEFRERVMGDVEAFVGSAGQHDDMALVLLCIGESAQVSG